MRIKWTVYACFNWEVMWFRIYPGGPGVALHTHKAKPLFSERHGYRKPILKVWKWRLFTLPKEIVKSRPRLTLVDHR